MCWRYDTRTNSDCRPCIVLSFSRHVKHFKAEHSINTKTKANLSRKHWLNYWHRCKHRCKRRVMHEIDARRLKVNHTTLYPHIVIACDGPKIRMCAKSDNIAMTTNLMVI